MHATCIILHAPLSRVSDFIAAFIGRCGIFRSSGIDFAEAKGAA